MQNFLHEQTMVSELLVQGSNTGPRKCTEACLAASNMWNQLWMTLGPQDCWEMNRTVCLSWEVWETNSVSGPSCPSKSWVITGFFVITACFLKGQASQGNNPPVSTHINGLIGLFSHSQNAGLSLTEMLSPSEPLTLKYPRNAWCLCKVEPSLPFSLSFTLLSFLFLFPSTMLCVIFGTKLEGTSAGLTSQA